MYIYLILQHLTIFSVAVPLDITRTSYRHFLGRRICITSLKTVILIFSVVKPQISYL